MPGLAIVASVTLLAAACQREVRPFQDLTVASDRSQKPALSPISPGSPSPAPAPAFSPYQNNAYATGEGKRLFDAFNCSGCHAHGGGGMGPPLMDDEWRYGGRIDQIATSIAEGRPNGMPSWRGKLTSDQIWSLAAYVRSLSGLPSKDAVSSRSESMSAGTPQSLTPHGDVRNSDAAKQ